VLKPKGKRQQKAKHRAESRPKPHYDAVIRAHYDEVAEECGALPQSTMADDIIRGKETEAILGFVAGMAATRGQRNGGLVVVDAGCGNGYTLRRLVERFPEHQYVGIEQNDKLRSIAGKVLKNTAVHVMAGDIRDLSSISAASGPADVLICQRVLINIMDVGHQKRALSNLVEMVRPGGALIFIETFQWGLDNLNAARAELSLQPIPPPVHNLPLPQEFFNDAGLIGIDSGKFGFSENSLSTHYFVSRVLYPALLKALGTALKRNAHFIRFLSEALPEGVGDYTPLRIKAFAKGLQ